MRVDTWQDRWIGCVDDVVRVLLPKQALEVRPSPAARMTAVNLNPSERRHAAGLMRVNHSGEICAQALYQGQALVARSAQVRQALAQSAQEEADHLRWCQERIQQLNSHTSYLSLIWYVGSLWIGIGAGLAGDAYSLGFLAETEAQVTRHLNRHLDKLPAADRLSRRIVEQMSWDECQHQRVAEKMGAKPLPEWVKQLMNTCSKLMIWTAYRV